MNADQAESAVSTSGFLVATIYGYRKLVQPSTKSSTVAPVSHFVIGFGFSYIVLALIAQAAPELGGMLAILVAIGTLLTEGTGLVGDLNSTLASTATATKG